MSEIEQSIRQFALQNAVLHDGKAEAKNVINKVIGKDPEIKRDMGVCADHQSYRGIGQLDGPGSPALRARVPRP